MKTAAALVALLIIAGCATTQFSRTPGVKFPAHPKGYNIELLYSIVGEYVVNLEDKTLDGRKFIILGFVNTKGTSYRMPKVQKTFASKARRAGGDAVINIKYHDSPYRLQHSSQYGVKISNPYSFYTGMVIRWADREE